MSTLISAGTSRNVNSAVVRVAEASECLFEVAILQDRPPDT
jgi:hypothetical protein